MATPIINQPQVAILDLEAVVKRPVVVTDADGNDSIAIRPMTILGLSWDHRALDGAQSAQFLATVKRHLESVVVTLVTREIWVCHLGVVDYREALELQERLRTARQEDELPDMLLTLEHPPVYTRGRRSGPEELPMGEDWYLAQGIEIVETDRGGKVTYHGPGQLVGYPIVRVDDVVAYVRTLEGALVVGARRRGRGRAAAAARGAPASPACGSASGRSRRSGCISSRGVTKHGFAINIDNDLQPFSWIVPCGLDGVQMTSLAAETGRVSGGMKCFRRRAALRAGARRSGAGSGWSAGRASRPGRRRAVA